MWIHHAVLLSMCLSEIRGACVVVDGIRSFGPGCSYQCHCTTASEQCDDVTGECFTSGCAAGWMGHGCQYVNIAYKMKASQSSTYGYAASRANDGNPGTYSRTRTMGAPWWRLELPWPTTISDIQFQAHDTASRSGLQGFSILIGNTTGTLTELCYLHDGNSSILSSVHIQCVQPIVGRYVLIQGSRTFALQLYEVAIPNGRNVAFRQQTNQSSYREDNLAGNAVDGTLSGYWRHFCTWTMVQTAYSPWWRLDLGREYLISGFMLVTHSSYTVNAQYFRVLFSSDVNFANTDLVYQDTNPNPPSKNLHFFGWSRSARYIRFELNSTQYSFFICEVQIFADCPASLCGWNCTQKCHCKSEPSGAAKVSGVCPSGCVGRWTGEEGRCDTLCGGTQWGTNCSQECGHCNNSEPCDLVSGHCPHGCQLGYKQEPFCAEECNNGTWGDNCMHQCGRCRSGNPCDVVTGYCDGCQEGYASPLCSDAKQKKQDGDAETDLDITAIAGGIVGGLLLIGLALLLFILLFRRNRSKRPELDSTTYISKLSEGDKGSSAYENIIPSEKAHRKASNDKPMKSLNSEENGQLNNTEEPTYTQVKNTEDTYYYVDVDPKVPAKTIQLNELWNYVRDRDFSEEFKHLTSDIQSPATVAVRPENIGKNRYKDMPAYDETRVILRPTGEEKESDYINASYIHGYRKPKAYIASQAPTEDTVGDFWQMIYQYKINNVVMLTNLVENGKIKCHKYWPDEGHVDFGGITINLESQDVFADYTIRILHATKKDSTERMVVHQYNFRRWPDKDVPGGTSSLVIFWRKVKSIVESDKSDSPLLVHCSAGVGRTGTYIGLDYLFDQGTTEGHVNAFSAVETFRRQRSHMVQLLTQYRFLHEALVEAFMLSGTATSCGEFPQVYQTQLETNPDRKKTKLLIEFERLKDTGMYEQISNVRRWLAQEDTDSSKDDFSAAKLPENIRKNRHSNILPANYHRPFLSNPVEGCNDYINAVIIPTHKESFGFLLTQTPLENTIIDFWRLVFDFKIHSIVCMDPSDVSYTTFNTYLPPRGQAFSIGPFTVTDLEGDEIKSSKRRLRVVKEGLNFSLEVQQFPCKFWSAEDIVPRRRTDILELFMEVELWQRQTGSSPITVHCMNGAKRSGLFCVLWSVLERLKVDKDVAIFQIVKQVKERRQQVIPDFEQYKFCHDVILEYLHSFDTYSNFA